MNVCSLACRDLARAARHHCDAFSIRPFWPSEADLIMDLVAAAAAAASEGGPEPRPSGLVAELQSRAGRDVTCWLARPRTAGNDADAGVVPVGLVSLVQSIDRVGRNRWSIGWLLVRPAARRQGLGRGLVAVAVRHARDAGADVVRAETSAAWPAARFWQAIGFVLERPGG